MKKTNNRGSENISSIIGADARMEGKLSLSSSVRIDGSFDGNLLSEGTVTIGHRGSIKGEIEADQVIIGGQVQGSIVARTRLVLESSAKVEAALATNSLVVGEGAVFNGHCGMGKEAVSELQERIKDKRVSAIIQETKSITLFDDDGNPLDHETQSAQAS